VESHNETDCVALPAPKYNPFYPKRMQLFSWQKERSKTFCKNPPAYTSSQKYKGKISHCIPLSIIRGKTQN
jgi:hypothetical protein